MRRGVVVFLHFAYWALYVLLLALMFGAVLYGARVPREVVNGLAVARLGYLCVAPNVLAFYLSYGVLFPRTLARRRVAATLGGGLLVTLVAAGLGAAGLRVLFDANRPLLAGTAALPTLVFWLALVAGVHTTIALVIRGFVEGYAALAAREALGRRAHELELALLRARLDPHFLFNTLNNIDVLIERDPDTASRYLHALSDLLRFVLYEARSGAIPLGDELATIEKYVALQRLRGANPRRVRYEATGDPAGLTVAPLVFLPFVENAFKHGGEARADDAIVVRVAVHGRHLSFECRNRYDPLAAASDGGAAAAPASAPTSESGGLGHPLIRRRLELLYPGRHALSVRDDGSTYLVALTLELDDPPLPPG